MLLGSILSFMACSCSMKPARLSCSVEPCYPEGLGDRATVYLHEGGKRYVLYDEVVEACGGHSSVSGPIPSPDKKYVLFDFFSGEGWLVLVDCRDTLSVECRVIDPNTKKFGPMGARQPLWYPNSKEFLFFSDNPRSEGGPWIYSVETCSYRICERLKGHHPDVFPEPRWGVPGRSVVMYYDGKATEIAIE